VIEEPHPDEPIRFFKDLYAVVVGVGLALAAEQIVDLDKSGVPIKWEDVPMFIAWISVALPFATSSCGTSTSPTGGRTRANEASGSVR